MLYLDFNVIEDINILRNVKLPRLKILSLNNNRRKENHN